MAQNPMEAGMADRPAAAGEIRRMSPTGGSTDDGAAALATHLDSAGHAVGGTSGTTEGLRDWLQQLQAASVACAVISNDDVEGIEHFLTSHGLRGFFRAIWSAEHRPRKPDPAAVHGLCAELGLAAADCALIGDANSDLRMAVAAGIPHQLALGYTAAWSTPPPLAEPHPRVHHWRELSLA
jgi:phosphoglycolate phosphatase